MSDDEISRAIAEACGRKADYCGDLNKMRDAIGDVVVCLGNLCCPKGLTLAECLNEACEQIKDRRGTLLPNGCFVKEEEAK